MKKKKYKKIKIIIFILLTLTIYINTLKELEKINLDIKNDNFYELLISNSSNLNNKINYKEIKNIINIEPNKLLKNNLIYTEKEEVEKEKDPVVVLKETKDPIIYIYNTHQTENYSSEYLADYSIIPNIMVTSYMLKENLEEYGIYSYVEERSVKEVLNKNNWKYAKSYKVSRSFMEEKQKEMPTLKYYIDLHRDSVKKKYTTVEINDISYAKIMLLIGLEHDNYESNLKEAQKINDLLNKHYPGISRGIYKKSGTGVNGIYNQDYSKYVFLFEIGGVENNINEVNNSMTALTKVFIEYLKGEGELDAN